MCEVIQNPVASIGGTIHVYVGGGLRQGVVSPKVGAGGSVTCLHGTGSVVAGRCVRYV